MQNIGSATETECDLHQLDWGRMFSRRSAHMKRTAVRELLKVTARPEIISFAGGLPAAELFPVARVQGALNRVLERVGGQSLQYGETEGLRGLREWIATECNKRLQRTCPKAVEFGPAVKVENILITSGAQQGLDLIGRVLLDEGDRVIVENPTYLALLSAWRPCGVRFLPVESEADGMRTASLESLLRERPRLIYAIPNFQNPQGTTLSRERRAQLLHFARQHGVAIVEDNPYGDLRYEGEPVPNILDLELDAGSGVAGPQHVIYTGTFSKVLMPGLRVGWVIAHAAVIEKLVHAKQVTDLHTSSLNQHLVLELLSEGFLADFLPVLIRNYRERRDAMLQALERYFPPEITWTRPEGGMFLMVNLPRSVNATALLPRALESGVAYVPGEEFHLNGEGGNTLRLNFSNASPSRIQVGIQRLADLFTSG